LTRVIRNVPVGVRGRIDGRARLPAAGRRPDRADDAL